MLRLGIGGFSLRLTEFRCLFDFVYIIVDLQYSLILAIKANIKCYINNTFKQKENIDSQGKKDDINSLNKEYVRRKKRLSFYGFIDLDVVS